MNVPNLSLIAVCYRMKRHKYHLSHYFPLIICSNIVDYELKVVRIDVFRSIPDAMTFHGWEKR